MKSLSLFEEQEVARTVRECFSEMNLTEDSSKYLFERDIWYWFFKTEIRKKADFEIYIFLNPKITKEIYEELKKIINRKVSIYRNAERKNIKVLIIQTQGKSFK